MLLLEVLNVSPTSASLKQGCRVLLLRGGVSENISALDQEVSLEHGLAGRPWEYRSYVATYILTGCEVTSRNRMIGLWRNETRFIYSRVRLSRMAERRGGCESTVPSSKGCALSG
jgi:hypothetical protein